MHARMRSEAARRRAESLRELQAAPGVLVLANPWDAGTARLLEHAGFRALASTSAGLAFTLGRRDGDGAVSADETFGHIRSLLAATTLPMTADLENGFGEAPETVAATIQRAGEIGLSGASIEDATYRTDDPIFDRSLAVERIHAAVEAARALPYPFTLTARSENFIRGRPELDDTLWRLQAFEAAGADVLYAPGLRDLTTIRTVCHAVGKPVNVIMGLAGAAFSVDDLAAAGVRRISLGSALSRAALGAFLRAAREVRERGTFTFAADAAAFADLDPFMLGRT
jgi:2-methylisocitrate lyase-like PEP mutase family enzyme